MQLINLLGYRGLQSVELKQELEQEQEQELGVVSAALTSY